MSITQRVLIIGAICWGRSRKPRQHGRGLTLRQRVRLIGILYQF